MQAMESQFDVCTEDLFNQTIKLEEMEKKAGNAEGEIFFCRKIMRSKKIDCAKLLWNLQELARELM